MNMKLPNEIKLVNQRDRIANGMNGILNEVGASQIQRLRISELDEFPDHPFHVQDDSDMDKLVESIKEQGVINPVVARRKDNGRFELISGHRRRHACKRLGLTEIPAIIVTMTDDEAIIQMVDSNIQREKLCFSEKAYAYKMRLEAMNRQGIRTDMNFLPTGKKVRTGQEIASQTNESQTQIYRYVRLTHLIKALILLVDSKKISFRAGVELSYLTLHEQIILYNLYDDHKISAMPNLKQSVKLRERSKEKPLTEDEIVTFLSNEPERHSEIVSIRMKPSEKKDIDDLTAEASGNRSETIRNVVATGGAVYVGKDVIKELADSRRTVASLGNLIKMLGDKITAIEDSPVLSTSEQRLIVDCIKNLDEAAEYTKQLRVLFVNSLESIHKNLEELNHGKT